MATGLVNADSYAGLRAMLVPANKRAKMDKHRRRGCGPTLEEAGRWALVRRAEGVTIKERVSELASVAATADATAAQAGAKPAAAENLASMPSRAARPVSVHKARMTRRRWNTSP